MNWRFHESTPFGLVASNRVIVSEGGSAVPQLHATESGIHADIFFLRNDGWILGAPKLYEQVAYQMWEGEWVEFWRRGQPRPQPIAEYKPKEQHDT